jgi:small subunit ribosomal protein S9
MSYPQRGNRGTGRRKEAIARVRLMKGHGKFLVNNQTLEEYLGFRESLIAAAKEPLNRLELTDEYDVLVKAEGGGKAGQAGAIRLGLARALTEAAPDMAKIMRDEDFLTRDPRVKERKKYGLHRARKASQYSKR